MPLEVLRSVFTAACQQTPLQADKMFTAACQQTLLQPVSRPYCRQIKSVHTVQHLLQQIQFTIILPPIKIPFFQHSSSLHILQYLFSRSHIEMQRKTLIIFQNVRLSQYNELNYISQSTNKVRTNCNVNNSHR